jgi:hypothetical protein
MMLASDAMPKSTRHRGGGGSRARFGIVHGDGNGDPEDRP